MKIYHISGMACLPNTKKSDYQYFDGVVGSDLDLSIPENYIDFKNRILENVRIKLREPNLIEEDMTLTSLSVIGEK